MKIVLVKYNAGNYRSVLHALDRLGVEGTVSSNPDEIARADKVVFPGVGEASSALRCLKDLGLHTLIPSLTQPVLGICLGLQVMCATTEENATQCLGIFPIKVRRLPAELPSLADASEDRSVTERSAHGHTCYPLDPVKVPHMGWNTISSLTGPLFRGIPEDSYVYFVHSYAAEPSDATIARCEHGVPFAAAIQKNNFYAVQFHPEKSGPVGSQILTNFLEL